MCRVIAGVRKFQTELYPEKKALFNALAAKQDPKVLFITCSDSRVDVALITQTQPGDMFIIRNAGNLIPPCGSPVDGTDASIEFAVNVLGMEHIIVCGHTNCGAIAAILGSYPESLLIDQWLTYAETILAYGNSLDGQGLTEAQRLHRCVEHNVRLQLEHLRTIPAVAAGMVSGKITLHGWVYNIETGEMVVYDPSSRDTRFISIDEAYPASVC